MPDPLLAEVREVLGRYGLKQSNSGEPQRAASGFSRAEVWQVDTTVGPLCVRRWPAEHPSAPKLQGIHRALLVAVAGGCHFVPNPLTAADGNTVTLLHGRLWEVSPWMPGEPDYGSQQGALRCDALWKALASFHLSFAKLDRVPRQTSPGLAERLRTLDHVVERGIAELRSAAVPSGWKALAPRRDEFVQLFAAAARFVRPPLVVAAGEPAISIPCIRDIRREHVLFTGDEVTGWVDFGALDYETPAADVARVLLEFFDGDSATWATRLEPYREACRGTPSATCSPQMIDAFVRTGILLSPWTWLRWILLEGYDFADQAAVLVRLDRLLSRLHWLVETV